MGGAGGASAATFPPVPLPNSQRQNLTRAPICGTSGAGAGGAAITGSTTGMGMIGEVEAGNMLGTNGVSPTGFLSRLPMFESSSVG